MDIKCNCTNFQFYCFIQQYDEYTYPDDDESFDRDFFFGKFEYSNEDYQEYEEYEHGNQLHILFDSTLFKNS